MDRTNRSPSELVAIGGDRVAVNLFQPLMTCDGGLGEIFEGLPMKHAVIVAHPNPDSFNLTVADTYCRAAEAHGHEVILRDLYRLGFDPRLQAGELPGPGFGPADDVQAERRLIGDADVFVFVYPLWFNAPPAMLKGYVERNFSMGFGYGPHRFEGHQPLLAGRKLISFSSSGSPTEWLKSEGSWEALRRNFDDHLAAMCGLEVVDHIHFGEIFPGMAPRWIEACRRQIREVVARRFPNASAQPVPGPAVSLVAIGPRR